MYIVVYWGVRSVNWHNKRILWLYLLCLSIAFRKFKLLPTITEISLRARGRRSLNLLNTCHPQILNRFYTPFKIYFNKHAKTLSDKSQRGSFRFSNLTSSKTKHPCWILWFQCVWVEHLPAGHFSAQGSRIKLLVQVLASHAHHAHCVSIHISSGTYLTSHFFRSHGRCLRHHNHHVFHYLDQLLWVFSTIYIYIHNFFRKKFLFFKSLYRKLKQFSQFADNAIEYI